MAQFARQIVLEGVQGTRRGGDLREVIRQKRGRGDIIARCATSQAS